MRRRPALWLLVLAAVGPPLRIRARTYPHRWVYVSRSLRLDEHVEDIRAIAATAAAHGLNGLVLSGGLDRLDLQPSAYFDRLRKVQAICEQHGLELIPEVFSAGYGSAVLAHDRNLAEGLPVRGALFIAGREEARLEPDPPPQLLNGGMENYRGHRLSGYQTQDAPGRISFVDTSVFHQGAASLRFENFGVSRHGHGRLMQEVAVRPRRCYRVSFWLKTEELTPPESFNLQVLAPDGRRLAPWIARAPATSEWRRLVWGFNSFDYDRVRIFVGVWGARSGRFWLDDLKLEEVGLLNVLRRPGTPLTVRSEQTGVEYEEGRDFAPVADPQLDFRFDRSPPPIRLLPGGRIREGERLRVDYYHGMAVNDGQVSVCMSEPKLYRIWQEQVRLIREVLGPRRFFLLSMDEIRAGGSCQACKRRGLTVAQILGDCLTRQFEMLRATHPEAEIFVWSDMLDPNHNARANYFLADGSYEGSWRYVPKELGIVTWHYARRRASLRHFSGLGFRTLAGAYYDADNLENVRDWLEALDETPGAVGIMYTTWRNKYELLADFGDLVSGPRD